MPNLIWFEWEKCPDGYTIEELRAEYLTFGSHRLGRDIGVPTKSAPAWVSDCDVSKDNTDGRTFSSDLGFFDFPIQVLVPKSERIVRSQSFMEENPGAFMMFANCVNSVEKTLLFVKEFGYPHKTSLSLDARVKLLRRKPTSLPLSFPLGIYGVDEFYEKADKMAPDVINWEEAKLRGSYGSLIRWLNEQYVDFSEAVDAIRVNLHENPADRTQPPLFSITPRSLEDALWLQFKIAVANNTQLQQCTECPTWFAYGTGTGRRKSALYCSPKCSKAAYRRRKAASQ